MSMSESNSGLARNEKLKQRLQYYEDLGLAPFYRDRASAHSQVQLPMNAAATLPTAIKEPPLSKPAPRIPVPSPAAPDKPLILPSSSGPSLFDAVSKASAETLLQIREDLGECTR